MLTLRNLSKSFGASTAVRGASVEFSAGEVVGLVGENGAGKTTLMRIVAGELAADAGSIERDGRALLLRSPRDADAHGIAIVHQHFLLVPELTVAENLALQQRRGFAFTSRRRIEADASAIIASSGIVLRDVSRRAGELSVGEKAKLELIKAIAREPRFLILDEPTSVLTPSEAEELFAVVRRIAARGVTVVFISHKLPEIAAVADRVVVMRRGAIVASSSTSSMTQQEIARAMVGAMVGDTTADIDCDTTGQPASAATPLRVQPSFDGREVVLECRKIVTRADERSVALDALSLTVRRGQIAAIVGVTGNGQSELAAALRGTASLYGGEIRIGGRAMGHRQLLTTRKLAHIPEDRTRDGLIAEMSIAENIALRDRRWNVREATARATALIDAYSVRAESPAQLAGALSGGNQQKVILARELDRDPRVLIAAEPTRGLDLVSTSFVHARLRDAARRGAAIAIITSDLDEAFALANVVYVMYRGRLSRGLSVEDARRETGALMAGLA